VSSPDATPAGDSSHTFFECARQPADPELLRIDQAIGGASARSARMFSLAGQHTTAGILAAAGFTDVAFTDVREPVCYGADSAQAYDFVTGLQATKDMLASLDPAAAEDARRELRVTLASHTTGDGVLFGARTWIITARIPLGQIPPL